MIVWLIRLSLLLILLGTILLAFSVKITRDPNKWKPKLHSIGAPYWEASRAEIIPVRFWCGLGLIVVGTLLQLSVTFL